MTDSRDQPDLETLGYRNEECPANHSSAPMGFNSAVIKPETRANKAEVADQHLDQPNQNLMIIEEIEGLISQVNEKIGKLNISGNNEMLINSKALNLAQMASEEIDLFQKTTLFELRKAFE